MKKVIIDVCGGDYSPCEQIKGGIDAVNADSEIGIILCGDKERINAELSSYDYDAERVQVLHAATAITNDDEPAASIRRKRDSSLVVALDCLNSDDEALGLISSGNTGAVLTGALLILGRIKGISRPALCPILPTETHGHVALIDCGANVDSKPEFLTHFAMMGSAYMKNVYGIENPRVGLLSVGVEEKKGNELTKAAFKLLKETPVNFVGNMEARDVLSGNYDVIVADGFQGNVCLKSIEGTASMFMKALKETAMSNLRSKIGAMFLKKSLYGMKNRLDYTAMGGALFLGVNKLVVKTHGSSKANTIKAAVTQIKSLSELGVINQIADDMARWSENKTENDNKQG